jgi:hypothetical protein
MGKSTWLLVVGAAAAFVGCAVDTTDPEDVSMGSQDVREEKKRRQPQSGDGSIETPSSPSAPAPESSTPESPSAPICGTGLTCSSGRTFGASACRQQASSMSNVYCCPNPGDRIVNGACVAPLCGSGLTCSASPTTGAGACRQSTTSTSDIYCCPIPGWRMQNGQCIAPLCGTGLSCAVTKVTGSSACRQTTTSTSDVYCCAAGQTIVNGKCQ